MIIDIDLLTTWGAVSKKHRKNEIIFHEGYQAKYYYQIISGKVRMYNLSSDTKELTLGIFEAGESFGEPPLFIPEPYPATAVAFTDCVVIYLVKERFHKLLDEYPALQKVFMRVLARKAYTKSLLAKELVESSPENRIMSFLDNFKKTLGGKEGPLHITYTRQEIANCTGLCVETVIRTLSKMNKEKKVSIVDKKLFY